MVFGCFAAVFVFISLAFVGLVASAPPQAAAYGLLSVFFFLLAGLSAVMGVARLRSAPIQDETTRLLQEQNALLRRSVKLQEAQLHLSLLQQAKPPESRQLEAPEQSGVVIQRGEVHTYIKPVAETPTRPEKEDHERFVDRLKRR
ncbi:MAG: hypothetical protein DYG88_07325 [Chloroflexi bacterium CFX4]|nr:hypothetical protein [Chloroflexi bacterium CFX4]MDL1921976.1 hypothetical protein [Chloroflexi bacterium CFX3]